MTLDEAYRHIKASYINHSHQRNAVLLPQAELIAMECIEKCKQLKREKNSNMNNWTSVKDKLPNKCGYYLVWFSYTCQDVDDEYYCEDFGKAFYFNSIIQEWDVKNIDIAHKPKVLYWQQVIPPTKEANTK